MIESNPAIGVKRYKSQGEGIHTWTEGEVAQFELCYPDGSKARLAWLVSLHRTARVRCYSYGMAARQRQPDHRASGKDQHVVADPDASGVNPGSRIDTEDNLTFILTPYGKPFTPLACPTGSPSGARRLVYLIAARTDCGSLPLRDLPTQAQATNTSRATPATRPKGSQRYTKAANQ